MGLISIQIPAQIFLKPLIDISYVFITMPECFSDSICAVPGIALCALGCRYRHLCLSVLPAGSLNISIVSASLTNPSQYVLKMILEILTSK